MKSTLMTVASLPRALLWVGVVFFVAEFALHFFGLPILEHDKIFMPTHDRYIGIMGATYSVLLILISTNVKKYQPLFGITMIGILAQGINGFYIAQIGGYQIHFHTQHVDQGVRLIGYGFTPRSASRLGLHARSVSWPGVPRPRSSLPQSS